MDRRETPSNGRVAHTSLRGRTEAERYVDGRALIVAVPHCDLLSTPAGPRDRQLLLGAGFRALEDRAGWAFGFAELDGYVGYVRSQYLEAGSGPTGMVGVARTYAKHTADLKVTEKTTELSFGARPVIGRSEGEWTAVRCNGEWLWAPSQHLCGAATVFEDPSSVAEMFLHTPYLWGGNTAFGIDCSGLVQAALVACGIDCPGDSDLQEARVGRTVENEASLRRNDLIFWKGHVGILLDRDTLLHANAHHMAVVIEPLEATRDRIAASGGGTVTSVRRPWPPASSSN